MSGLLGLPVIPPNEKKTSGPSKNPTMNGNNVQPENPTAINPNENPTPTNPNENNMQAGNPTAKAKQKPASRLPLFALNYISFDVKDLDISAVFYRKVMGFVIIRRPDDNFDHEGVWMFGHGVAIHLQEVDGSSDDTGGRPKINPADSHISFQCSNLYSMLRVIKNYKDMEVNLEMFQTKVDGKIVVNRINFHDPDGHIIEIADSQNLPIVTTVGKSPPKSMPTPNLEFSACTAKETCKPSGNCLCCEDDHDKTDGGFDLENKTSEHHLLAMNHVGYLCKSIEKSRKFYKEVLGFVSIDVPKDDNWEGKKHERAWLFGHGIGIHLIQEKCAGSSTDETNSSQEERAGSSTQFGIGFQCTNMYDVMTRLDEMKERLDPELTIKYEVDATPIKEDGLTVHQISTNDPDGNGIVFCTLHNLPIVPISECPPRKMPTPNLDLSKKEVPCKPKWPPCKCKIVEGPKVVSKPKVADCCGPCRGDRH